MRRCRRPSRRLCAKSCRERGIAQLYIHQADAFAEVEAGRNVVIVTPTASGKTLCYNLPVLNACMQRSRRPRPVSVPHQGARRRSASRIPGHRGAMHAAIRAFTMTAIRRRTPAKPSAQRANVVFTNPDMLHAGILPHHTKWARSFENLRYIVIDELHYYRGVYGSHLANVLRRLQAHLRILRLEAAIHLLLGHHRQPARTGRGADRAAFRDGRAQRRAARRESISSSTIRRWSIASSAFAAATSTKRGASRSNSSSAISRRWSSPTTAWPPKCW